MSWIDILSKLAAIANGLVTLARTCRDYIKSKKDSKKDPSTAAKQSDGPNDDCSKQS